MQNRILNLSKATKQGLAIAVDVVTSLFATWAAFGLRLDIFAWPQWYQWHVYLFSVLFLLPVFLRLGIYRIVLRNASVEALITIAKAVAIYGIILFVVLFLQALPGIPRSVGILQPLIFLVLVGCSRGFARFWLTRLVSRRYPQKRESRLLIYGAGTAGAQIADALLHRQALTVIGFLDDDVQLHGKTINGLHVYSPTEVERLLDLYDVTDVLLALPSVSRSRRKEILASLSKYQMHIRSLPDLTDLASGKVTVSDIHELDVMDLLGRDPVQPDTKLIHHHIGEKIVLVTGAGGSIGSELCRQILEMRPNKLLLMEHNEYSLYVIHAELHARLQEIGAEIELVPLLGNICNFQRVSDICKVWRPHMIYHAAAYKHVPLVEHNPAEGIRNNVFGTYNVARAAVENGISDCVLISTDKAVRPTNVMGASKRLAEMILQALSITPRPDFEEGHVAGGVENVTRFSMVRFGNVLGSSGSVVPLFHRQIGEGGPITLTDPEVTRYFMTIPEAAQLVMQAAAMADGGDVFVLDMGEPVKIIDLAHRMIELSGLSVKNEKTPDGDIEVKIIGLRPGEKLYEELLIGENPQPTAHARIMKANEDCLSWERLQNTLGVLFVAAENNNIDTIREILHQLVNGYQPSTDVVDWIYLEENNGMAG